MDGNGQDDIELIPAAHTAEWIPLPPDKLSQSEIAAAAKGKDIDLDPILAIHRGADGYIVFGRFTNTGNGKEWETVGAFRPAELRDNLPGLGPHLFQDSFMSVNSLYRPYSNIALSAAAYPLASRREANLRYLNACYADIDCGRTDEPPDPQNPNKHLAAEDCVGQVLKIARDGTIPYPSMMAYSGRGLYLFWLLRDEDNAGKPARSYNPARVAFYKQVNRAIHERLRAALLPVDRAAHDAARVLRVPGSVHSGAGKQVEYTALLVKNSRNPSGCYTLGELADLVGAKAITAQTKALGYDAPKTGPNPNKRKGYRAAGSYAAADIEAIFQHQGGWTYPGRRKRITIYATMLKQSGMTKPEILARCSTMARNCKPPYPHEPAEDTTSPRVSDIVNSVMKGRRKRYRNEILADLFGVTAKLAQELELRSIVPPVVRAMRANARLLTGRKIMRETRRRHIAKYLETNPTASARAVFRVLQRKGVKTNPETVNEDMNALGHRRAPGTGGRPRKRPYPTK